MSINVLCYCLSSAKWNFPKDYDYVEVSILFWPLFLYLICGALCQFMSHDTLGAGILTKFWYKLPRIQTTSLHVCPILAQDSQPWLHVTITWEVFKKAKLPMPGLTLD